MSGQPIKLFISHASEDKETFANALAESLKADSKFDVWYDTWSLLVAQSLLKQISKGLRQCQYGIVVLSKHFFAKKWPQNELDGLFDLEPADHSLILPIWHEINKEEVSQYSPILAARVATKSEWGVKRLVSDLKRSIEVGERTKEISSPLGLQIRAFQDTAGAQELYKKWAWSPGGIQAVWTEWARISEIATGILDTHDEKRFEVKSGQNFANWIQVTGPIFTTDQTRLDGSHVPILHFDLREMAMNSIFTARCTRRVALQPPGIFARTREPQILDELEVKPYCTKAGKAVWQTKDQAIISTQELVEDGLSFFFEVVHKGIRGEL